MELQKCLEMRKSIRKYKEAPVSREIIKDLIQAASLAPSWKNTQVSRYYVADGESKKKFSKECLPTFNQNNTENAAVLMVSTVVKGQSGVVDGRGNRTHLEEGFSYFDNGLQVQNICLKAMELGLGTLIMGIYYEAKVREFFEIPETEDIVAVIAVGHPDVDPDAKPRKEVEEILKFADK